MEYGFKYGLKRSLTIVIGYAPVAITFGLLAARYGISFWEAGLMSLLVFAGASQFIAVEMLHQGATAWMIGLTTLIVNIRHVLMSISMSPFFETTGKGWTLALAQGLTDETFVLNSRLLKDIDDEKARRRVMLGVNLGAFASWVIFTFIGGLVGAWLPVNFSGFQFALLALFIILTAVTLTKNNVITYMIAAVAAILFKLIIPGKLYLVLSVAVAAGFGAWLKKDQVRNR